MKKLYIIVSALFITCILLFISAFFYLDKENHKTYSYIVNLEGHDVGTIKIDKFVTEDKLIYKSVSNSPFYPILADSKSRITLDRKYNIENYYKENFGNGASERLSLENKDNNISFVATFQSEFAYLSKIPIRGGTFVFEEDSPATYLPIIENYDFKRGRAQGFNAITQFYTFLPPLKRFVTLTSVRDEYIKIGSKKIKTECMLLKIKNYPEGRVWVSKSDRSLIMAEVPKRNLKITRTFSPKSFDVKEYMTESDSYVTRDASFNNKNVQLSGSLTVPRAEGKYPAVLLIWGSGPQDRQYQGFFASIADHLSKNGFCVFRFDKRGIGSSGGDFSSATDKDEIEDLNMAFEYLAGQKEVDPQKIAVIGHEKGGYYASELASKRDSVKAIVLMAPISSIRPGSAAELKNIKVREDYLKLVMKSDLETLDRVKGTKNRWASILGKRCFLKRMREELNEDPIETIKKVKIPVLILQGKEDKSVPIESASLLDKALEESGNAKHSLIYFGYLDYFFGKKVNDGIHRIHYEVDREALETVKNWLKSNFESK